jgi:hypothetical protein
VINSAKQSTLQEAEMVVDRKEARALLKDVEGTEQRAREVLLYAHIGDHLILWGIIWGIGYSGAHLLAARNTHFIAPMWFSLIVIGGIATTAGVAEARRRSSGGRPKIDIRPALTVLASLFFIWLWIYLGHLGWREQVAFAPTLFGTIFFVTGLWAGRLLSVLGAIFVGLTLAGYAWAGSWYDVWMAAVGGASLIAAGFWLRR